MLLGLRSKGMRRRWPMSVDAMTRRRSLTTNSLLSLIAWVFPILLGFISTPILVSKLGSEQYGLFAVVLGFISYSFTFGIGKVASKYVPEFQAGGESEKVTQTIAATFWLSLAIGLVGSIALLLTAPLIVSDVLLISPGQQQLAVYSLYLAGAIGLVLMLSQVFQSVLQGLHRFDNYLVLTNLNALLLGAGNIFLAISGFGVATLFAWNLGVVSITAVLFYLRAVHLLPGIRFIVPLPRSIVSTVARYAGNIILYQIFANVLFIFERSWIVRRLGAEALTFYVVPMLLAIYMHGFMASAVQAIFPVVNELLGDRKRLIEIYQRASKIIFVTVVFIVTNLIACGDVLLALWVSPELASRSYPLLVPHSLSFGLIAMGIMSWQLAEAFKYPSMNVIMTALWMAIGVPLMIIAAGLWQSEGVAWSRFVAVLVTFPITLYAEKRFLGKLHVRFWLASAARVAAAAVILFAVEILLVRALPVTWPALFLTVGLGTLAFALALFVAGFFTAEDKRLASRLLLRRTPGSPE
jgi:O-antigen/teichoic acid export membrane protein